MKKHILFLASVLCFNKAYAYQIASNHSYLRNSAFTTDFDVNITGFGDFRVIYNQNENQPTDTILNKTDNTSLFLQTEIILDINLQKKLTEISAVGFDYVPVYNSSYRDVSKYYLYYEGYYGRLEFGNVEGIFDSMKVGADTIALGSGGIGGNFIRNVKLTDGYTYLLSPTSLLSQNFGLYNNSINQDYWNDTKYFSKINYISPDFYGLKIGGSIIPNTKLTQNFVGDPTKNANIPTLTNDINMGTFFNYGISYINTFDNVGIAISAVGEQNIANSVNKNADVKEEIDYEFKSYEIGANINYFGWTLAGSIGTLSTNADQLKTGDPLKNILQKEGTYTTYGFAYEFGNLAMSATIFDSEYKDYTKFNSVAIALEKKISKGVSVYGEYIKYKTENYGSNNVKVTNNGSDIFAGMLINFE